MKTGESIKNFWNNPKTQLVNLTIWPILIFALSDMDYWGLMKRNFGLNNSWYVIAINFHKVSGGIDISYFFPNDAFILFVITVVGLNVLYYKKLMRKNS
jgi:hypothetical protein